MVTKDSFTRSCDVFQDVVLLPMQSDADCRRVQHYLRQWGHRLVLHYLPPYAPDANPIERGWWHLHEEITRGHHCQSLEELLVLVFAWLQQRTRFTVEDAVYTLPQAA